MAGGPVGCATANSGTFSGIRPGKKKRRKALISLAFLAPRPGLEPGTYGLTGRRELGLNQRHRYQIRSAIWAQIGESEPGRFQNSGTNLSPLCGTHSMLPGCSTDCFIEPALACRAQHLRPHPCALNFTLWLFQTPNAAADAPRLRCRSARRKGRELERVELNVPGSSARRLTIARAGDANCRTRAGPRPSRPAPDRARCSESWRRSVLGC